MSFRLFVYWCALCGGWAALIGWAVGRQLTDENTTDWAATGIKGMMLGGSIALALGLVDAIWVFSLRQFGRVLPRLLLTLAIGSIGGLIGAVTGQRLYQLDSVEGMLVLGWCLTGMMVGLSLGAFDFLAGYVRQEDLAGAWRKVRRGVIGGLFGGLLGSLLYWQLGNAWNRLLPDVPDLWTPSSTGFVIVGLCMGLAISVAQVVLKDAWLKVEKGFRAGREVLLNRSPWKIGRAESCDIALFGDPTVELVHAWIWREGGQYLIADAGSRNGTYVNHDRVTQPRALQSDDLIQLGNALLRFSEVRKRSH